MSWQAVQAVMEHSRAKGSERMVLMVIATHAPGDGLMAFVPEDTLRKEANMSERNLRYTLAKLRESGELLIAQGTGRGHANTYTLRLEKGAADCPFSETATPAERGQQIAPLPIAKGGNPASQRGQSSAERGQQIAPHPREPKETKKTITHIPRPTKVPDLSPERRADITELHAHYCSTVEPVALSPPVSGVLNRAIGEKGLAYCRDVVDGCALDDWEDRKLNNSLTFIFGKPERMERLAKIAKLKKGGGHGGERKSDGRRPDAAHNGLPRTGAPPRREYVTKTRISG